MFTFGEFIPNSVGRFDSLADIVVAARPAAQSGAGLKNNGFLLLIAELAPEALRPADTSLGVPAIVNSRK